MSNKKLKSDWGEPDCLRLAYKGKLLSDTSPISSYSIKNGDFVAVALNKKGWAAAPSHSTGKVPRSGPSVVTKPAAPASGGTAAASSGYAARPAPAAAAAPKAAPAVQLPAVGAGATKPTTDVISS